MEMLRKSWGVPLSKVFLWLLLPAVVTAAVQLPPEIQADRYLLQAERAIQEQDFQSAKTAMDAILELQAQHALELPEQFSFRYAEVLGRLGLYDEAIEFVTEYLTMAGRDGEFYREALELLNAAEAGQAAAETARARLAALSAPAGDSPTVEGQPAGGAGSPAAGVAADSDAPPRPGAVFRDCDGCPEMVVIPAGTFRMGCVSGRDCDGNERPVHAVTKYEVTQAEWEAVMGANPSGFSGCDRCPVEQVSWNDAQEFIGRLNAVAGEARYRLPTEAEWEYAARAGRTTSYSWGNDVGRNRANCDGCGSQWDRDRTAPVGSFAANAWGLHDMHGNVWEWAQDCWNEGYRGAPTDGSAWESGDCGHRVVRGGSWYFNPRRLRAAYHGRNGGGGRYKDTGFRVARTIE